MQPPADHSSGLARWFLGSLQPHAAVEDDEWSDNDSNLLLAAQDALLNHEYPRALRKLHQAERDGLSAASLSLGNIYSRGLQNGPDVLVKPDNDHAAQHYITGLKSQLARSDDDMLDHTDAFDIEAVSDLTIALTSMYRLGRIRPSSHTDAWSAGASLAASLLHHAAIADSTALTARSITVHLHYILALVSYAHGASNNDYKARQEARYHWHAAVSVGELAGGCGTREAQRLVDKARKRITMLDDMFSHESPDVAAMYALSPTVHSPQTSKAWKPIQVRPNTPRPSFTSTLDDYIPPVTKEKLSLPPRKPSKFIVGYHDDSMESSIDSLSHSSALAFRSISQNTKSSIRSKASAHQLLGQQRCLKSKPSLASLPLVHQQMSIDTLPKDDTLSYRSGSTTSVPRLGYASSISSFQTLAVRSIPLKGSYASLKGWLKARSPLAEKPALDVVRNMLGRVLQKDAEARMDLEGFESEEEGTASEEDYDSDTSRHEPRTINSRRGIVESQLQLPPHRTRFNIQGGPDPPPATPHCLSARPSIAAIPGHSLAVPIDPLLAALEAASRVNVKCRCAVCGKQGTNFPRCSKCERTFCSRECRVSEIAGGDGIRHLCSAQ